jgi:uncharacterized delta-60 repeat protein
MNAVSWLVLALATTRPLLAHCQTSNDFAITADLVWALAAQPDGKTVFGGSFNKLVGQPFQNIARVNADGTLDGDFRPLGIGVVTALAVQADGRILVAAYLTNLTDQVVSILERFNANGSPDGTFVSGGPGDFVNALALQPDGKILVGGPFKALAGLNREYLARLNVDGTIDGSFNPTIDASPYSIVTQPDRKILLGGGGFTRLDGQPRKALGRLNPDGTLDVGFNPSIGNPWSMALQADGKILLSAGALTGLTNTPNARLNADGTLDTTFNSALRKRVDSLAIQTDGKILGTAWDSGSSRVNSDGSQDASFNSLTNFAGTSLGLQASGQVLIGGNFIYGLTNNEAATNSLTYDGTNVTWLRSGASPEVWWTIFELSTNGTDWTSLGAGARVPGGWQVSGVLLPAGYTLRASGGVAGGYLNDSFWVAQSYLGKPVMITQPIDRTNYVGTSTSLAAHAEGSKPLSYQWLRNGVEVITATNSNLSLHNIQISDAGDYSVIISNQFGGVTSSVANVTVLLPPLILIDGNFGFTNGQFGFNIAGPAGQTFVVEWTGTFVNWVPLQTNVFGPRPYYFSEPRSTKHSLRFYRARMLQ